MKDIITIGQEINTLEGYIEITAAGKASNAVYVNEYTIIWDDETDTEKGYNKESKLMTLHDIARRMKEMDGKNHELQFAN